MNKKNIQTKRKAKKGYRTYFAKTAGKSGKKTQRAATATVEDIEGDIPQVGIGRALSVILILHLVAIAAIYMGTKWRGGDDSNSAVAAYNDEQDSTSNGNANSGKLNVGTPASYEQVRQQESNNTRQQTNVNRTNINDNPVNDRPQIQINQRKPRLIQPKINPNAASGTRTTTAPQMRGTLVKYKVVKGDTGYGIARKKGVKFADIQAVNKGVNLSRLNLGQMINIPSK